MIKQNVFIRFFLEKRKTYQKKENLPLILTFFYKQAICEFRINQIEWSQKENLYTLLHEKIRNQRQDYLHKISKHLVDNYDTICLEGLAVKNMVKNHNLARAISDMGWGEFRTMLEYKAEWYGKNISVIGRFEPSSKTCSCCGFINKELTLKDREWTCVGCGVVHDRDVNAAINIKNFGLRNKSSVAQSDGMPCACNVEAH
jgi:putative transposase